MTSHSSSRPHTTGKNPFFGEKSKKKKFGLANRVEEGIGRIDSTLSAK
jgi:hypothetical protein